MKERILVTGGTGYIGSHTVVELQNSGYEVIIIDNLSNSSADVVDNIEKVSGIRPVFEKLDCLDFAGLDAVFTKYKGIKAIIHFAASKAVGESVQKPLLYYRNNLVSLINLLELMPKHGVEGIVFSSSCTVYGQPDELPVTEKAPIKKAESPYGNTKQINEEIIRDTVASGAPINAIMLRYFNPIGAHPTALLGELPNGVPQNLIPYLTQTAIGIREKLSVFGDDYDTPDGSCIRDFINVVDLAKAHVIAIRRILEQKQKEKVEVLQQQLNDLKTEKESAVLTLETAQASKAFNVTPGVTSSEEEKMLERVRDGVKKQKEAADGARIAYESSTTVQKQRLDKKMKDDEIDKKLQELKAKKGK